MKNKKGFTLVELVIVIAVIAILAAVLLPTFAGILERARENTRLQKATSARDELLSSSFNSITEIEGYLFLIEDSVYQIENGKIVNITDLVDINEIQNTYTTSTVQSSNSSITIYEPTDTKVEKTYIDFTLNEENKTASVVGYNATPSGKLIIPAYIQGEYSTEIIEKEFFSFDSLYNYFPNIETYFKENPKSDKVFKLNYGDNNVKIYNKDNYDIWSDFDELSCYSYFLLEKEATIYCTGKENYKVVSISYSAFSNCTTLTSVDLPNTLESIDNFAFSGCSLLSGNLILPDSLKRLGNRVFNNTKIEFSTYNNCNYLPSETNPYFVLYSVIDSSLTSIDIHNDTNIIAGSAFSSSKITSISIPDSVIDIGYAAFYNCKSLTSINIPNNVINIGSCALKECTSLTSVTISNNVTSIGSIAFYGCSKLNTVYFNGTIDDWCKIKFTDRSYLPQYATAFYMLDSTGNYYNVKEVEIPNTITNIEYTFSDFKTLTSITIPDSVKSIGSNAFRDCTNLASITIPNSVTNISDYAFYGCSSLTSIILPTSVESINDYAFSYCKNLKSITIPNSVKSIGNQTFIYCSNLKTIYYNGTVEDWCKLEFTENSNLLTYATIVYMQDNDNNYYSISEIEIPNTISSIGDYAFYGCKVLTSITIPNSVKSIGNQAFRDCTNLTSITISDGVTFIDDFAFYGCSSLTSIILPDGITSIGTSTFSGCTSLSFVNIPNSVTSISGVAFYGCSSLTSITIPDSVTNISARAFSSCTNLRTFYYGGTVENWCKINFAGGTGLVDYATTIYMLDSNNNYYSVTEIKIPNTISSIGNYTFYGFKILTSITIPNSVKSIGSNAFRNCTNLTSINLPDSVTNVGDYAFYGCTNLTSITFKHSTDDNLTIGSNAFYLSSTTETIIYIEDTLNINSIISSYNWSNSQRTVTYSKLEG